MLARCVDLDGGLREGDAPAMGKKRTSGGGQEKGRVRFHRDMLVCDAVEAHPGVKDVLLEFDLPCHRCVVAWHETLAEGCYPLGIEVDRIVERLNALDEG